MVFCGESIITEISVYVSFYMSEFIIQSTCYLDGFIQRIGYPFSTRSFRDAVANNFSIVEIKEWIKVELFRDQVSLLIQLVIFELGCICGDFLVRNAGVKPAL